MNYMSIFSWMLIIGFGLAIPLSSLTAEEQKKEPSQQVVEGQVERPEAAIPSMESQDTKLANVAAMPVYIPPKRGAPAGRVSGGSRGAGSHWH